MGTASSLRGRIISRYITRNQWWRRWNRWLRWSWWINTKLLLRHKMQSQPFPYFQGNTHNLENDRHCLVRNTHRHPAGSIRVEISHIQHDSSLISIHHQNDHRKLYSTSSGHCAFDTVPHSSSQPNPNYTTPTIIIAISTQGRTKVHHYRGMATYMDTVIQDNAIYKTENDSA